MKRIIPAILFILLSAFGYAQSGPPRTAAVKPPLPLREVSGIVKDSTDNALSGATVKLKSATDSLSTTTNEDGIFVFKNVKSATFVMSVSSIGFRPLVKRLLNNDLLPRLVLDPLVLNSTSKELDEVVINGAPSITYKTDTVEYKASDYKVRPNATVDELLKKMEGMEVGTDGSVTHQGQQITKARLNGKDYSGGNLAQAIQSLGADIVEKIQVVDDYGDQAARTGIKDGDPQKVLNITTKADRSVGNTARISGGVGNDGRYESRVALTRTNGNQVISVIGTFNNTVNGVASTGIAGGTAGGNNAVGGGNAGSGGSGGTTTTNNPSISYRDQWGKKIQVNMNYRYTSRNVNSINTSDGQRFSTLGTTFFKSNRNSQNNSDAHNFSFELEYNIDSANFLRVTPSFSYSGSLSENNSTNFQTGLIHQDIIGFTSSKNTTPNYGGIVFYQHIFKKPRRNFSIQVNYTTSDQEQENNQNNHIIYYRDSSSTILKDSLVNRYITRSNLSKNLRTSMTYVEPLSPSSQLEFNAQMNYRGYDNEALTSKIDASGRHSVIDSLSNIFNYSFTELRLAANYRFTKPKYNFSLGLTAVPTLLEGTKVTGGNIDTRRTNFNLIPIARFQYAWSRQERVSINYSGSPTEPSFNQIQPVRDESNPQNPVVGNPNLKPSFRHTIAAQYNNYIANSKLNLSANVNTSFINNQIVSNTVQIRDNFNTFKNETRYVNLSGIYTVNGNYNIAKQLADRKYNLSLIGNVTYGHGISMSNNEENVTTTWRFNQRFGPRINPNESIEVNPFIAYDVARTFYTLPKSINTNVRTLSMNIDGRFFFLEDKTFIVGYNASKNYVKGISNNLSRNPLVINTYVEKEFLKKRNLVVNLQVFDILKQNNFVNQVTTENSVTNTLTNALSRYFMLSVRLNLQKWSGSPKRNGQILRRRGDGSFIQ
ncbi:MAG: TonB-dependent receptor [Pedobacter sp.]|nr:MAG: TonB-dependent receptor [Pedobacter sp.]